LTSDLIDHISIYVKAGDGGDGSRNMRREKYIPNGGPDGGDGGRGGSVVLYADANMNTLLDLKRRVHWRASEGGKGGGKRCSGSEGALLRVPVPPGTVVFDQGTKACLGDLYRDGEQVLVARGGRGGRGNMHFANAQQKAPRFAENGEPGEERWLILDLQMLAEVGLVGFPNVGKSTLLSVISRAEPKIGDYPFTTLQPMLGVVNRGEHGIVFADLPGLVEGASEGVGLGFQFLQHIERTRVLLHVLDLASVNPEDPLERYRVLRHELTAYSQDLALRPELVAVNKCDLTEHAEALEALQKVCKERGIPLFPISCHLHQGLEELLQATDAHLIAAPPPPRRWAEPLPARTHYEFLIEFEVDCWRVFGQQVELLVLKTAMDDEEAVLRLQRKMLSWGVEEELIKRGAKPGDTVRVGRHLFDFEPTPEWMRNRAPLGPAEVEVRPSQVDKLERRSELRQSAKQAATAAAADVGTRGRGRKHKERPEAK
jgi:GTP-binding protein